MYILHSDITENSKNLLYEVIDGCKNASLEFRDTGEFLHSEWAHGNFDGHNNEGKTQFTCDVIVKCFASKFFPEFDKIIYSDVDVVFMDDISELYDVDLTDKYIAAVKNAFMKFDQKSCLICLQITMKNLKIPILLVAFGFLIWKISAAIKLKKQ